MKILLRSDSTNSQHTHMTLFIDGKNCGKLCMSPTAAIALHEALMWASCSALWQGNPIFSEFVSSGIFAPLSGAAR